MNFLHQFDLVLFLHGIHASVLLEGACGGFDHQVQGTQAALRPLAGQAGAQRHRLSDVHFGGEGDLGHGLQALHHTRGNGLAHTPDGHNLCRLCCWL